MRDHFEAFLQVYEERFERKYGFWRPYLQKVIYRYLECGDLHNGFARVKCKDCGHEYLLAFSCKRRHFCPSCHQKRVVEFGEWSLHISIDNNQNLNSVTPFSCRCILQRPQVTAIIALPTIHNILSL